MEKIKYRKWSQERIPWLVLLLVCISIQIYTWIGVRVVDYRVRQQAKNTRVERSRRLYFEQVTFIHIYIYIFPCSKFYALDWYAAPFSNFAQLHSVNKYSSFSFHLIFNIHKYYFYLFIYFPFHLPFFYTSFLISCIFCFILFIFFSSFFNIVFLFYVNVLANGDDQEIGKKRKASFLLHDLCQRHDVESKDSRPVYNVVHTIRLIFSFSIYIHVHTYIYIYIQTNWGGEHTWHSAYTRYRYVLNWMGGWKLYGSCVFYVCWLHSLFAVVFVVVIFLDFHSRLHVLVNICTLALQHNCLTAKEGHRSEVNREYVHISNGLKNKKKGAKKNNLESELVLEFTATTCENFKIKAIRFIYQICPRNDAGILAVIRYIQWI